jgi:RNA recognition motif-containing protein
MTKIYVGNLSQQTTEQDLHQAFTAFGQVQSVNIVRARHSGDSVGYGFVNMAELQQAQAAITALQGQAFMGNTIKVEMGQKKRRVPQKKNIRA